MRRFVCALRRFPEALLDVLAPERCGACGSVGVHGVFCPDCHVSTLGSALDSQPVLVHGVPVLALGPFEPPLSVALKHFKYSGRTDLARPLAELWWRRWGPAVASANALDLVLVPVPLHPGRLVERGYNQSALLANHLARLAGARVAHDLIERVHATAQQARLAARQRHHNLRGAFGVSQRSLPASTARVVLIDDVVTTGATLAACQAACRALRFGFDEVWTLAHTETPGKRRAGAD